jgi:hypothetical protein
VTFVFHQLLEKLQQHIHQIESQISTTDAVMLKWISCNNVDTLFYQTFLTEMLSLGKPFSPSHSWRLVSEFAVAEIQPTLNHHAQEKEFQYALHLEWIY